MYLRFGEMLCGFPISKKGNPNEYNMSKVFILSSGYLASAQRLWDGCRQKGISITMAQAEYAWKLFRDMHPAVVKFWDKCDTILGLLYDGGNDRLGPIAIADRAIYLPNGLQLHYDLRWAGPSDPIWSKKQKTTKQPVDDDEDEDADEDDNGADSEYNNNETDFDDPKFSVSRGSYVRKKISSKGKIYERKIWRGVIAENICSKSRARHFE